MVLRGCGRGFAISVCTRHSRSMLLCKDRSHTPLIAAGRLVVGLPLYAQDIFCLRAAYEDAAGSCRLGLKSREQRDASNRLPRCIDASR